MSEDIKLYNVNDGLTGRDGGPYLDEVEAREAEIRRAQREGRKPDLDKPGPYAGTQLISEGQLLSRGVGVPIASKVDAGDALVAKGVKETLSKPVATRPNTATESFAPGVSARAPKRKQDADEERKQDADEDLLTELDKSSKGGK